MSDPVQLEALRQLFITLGTKSKFLGGQALLGLVSGYLSSLISYHFPFANSLFLKHNQHISISGLLS